ncbi:hypothetical protein GCM10010246_48470 [Streptomyces cuspidosporus]|uniref:Lipoprotein n=1 Tax=Streptomyces cuspidosporus TaxID=66882 RepID=A0ABP5TJE5_9ACTN
MQAGPAGSAGVVAGCAATVMAVPLSLAWVSCGSVAAPPRTPLDGRSNGPLDRRAIEDREPPATLGADDAPEEDAHGER